MLLNILRSQHLSEPLNVLHEIMRHRFKLPSNKDYLDFRAYDGTDATNRSRANNLAYEVAATTYGEALERLILPRENEVVSKNTIISADMWIKHSFEWLCLMVLMVSER